MKNSLNSVLITAILLALVLGCVAPAVNNGVFADTAGLENEIINKIGAFPANWGKVQFQNTGNDNVDVWIDYPEKPELPVLESDTKRVAEAILDVLESKGYDRKKHYWLLLVVRGNLHCPSCDHRPHPLGETRYNRDTDGLEFSKDWFDY